MECGAANPLERVGRTRIRCQFDIHIGSQTLEVRLKK